MKDNIKNLEVSEVMDLFEHNYKFSSLSGDSDSNSRSLVLDEREYNDDPLKYRDGGIVSLSSIKSLDLHDSSHCGCEYDCCGCMCGWGIRSSYSKRLRAVTVILSYLYNY